MRKRCTGEKTKGPEEKLLSISLLGPPKVSLEGRGVRFGRKKALALLCYLAAEGKKGSRGELAELLWPQSDEQRARKDLRSTLSRLRKTLGEDGARGDGSSKGAHLLVIDGDLLGNGQVNLMVTAEDLADPVGKFMSREHPIGLDRLAFAMDPPGLYRVEPRALLGKKAAYYAHSATAFFDLPVVGGDPAFNELALVPGGIVSQTNSRAFLPNSSSFFKLHLRNCVVMALTGRPSTNRS